MTELMSKEEIVRNLPPGGGIHAKQAFLEAFIAEKWPDVDRGRTKNFFNFNFIKLKKKRKTKI